MGRGAQDDTNATHLLNLHLVSTLSPVGIDHASTSPTKRKLIVAGERLIAERGVAGLVLEEVARAAGQSNKFAVQYHFTDKAGLIRSIYDLRMRRIAVRRAELLKRAMARGSGDDIVFLLETIAIPLAEQVDDAGLHTYARFWLQLMASAEFDRTAPSNPVRSTAGPDPTADVIALMSKILCIPLCEMHRRLYLFGAVLPLTIVDHDNQLARGTVSATLEEALADSIARTATAIGATDGN